MCKRLVVFGFVAVAFLLMCNPSWATCDSPAFGEGTVSITCHYTPSVTSNTFSYPGGDSLRIEFRAVLRNFDLTMTRSFITLAAFAARLGSQFPEGSTCYQYAGHPNACAVYDATGPLPIKGTDYDGPVTWELVYVSSDTSGEPAFAHAKGASTLYTENILQFYSEFPVFIEGGDPSMQGESGGTSSVAAVKEPAGNDCFAWVSPSSDFQTFTVGTEVEVAFQLFPSSSCTGEPIRDKDARLSVARTDTGQPVFVPLGAGGNRFHFNNKEKVNEQQFDTQGLPPGTYVITIFSDEFGRRSRTIFLF